MGYFLFLPTSRVTHSPWALAASPYLCLWSQKEFFPKVCFKILPSPISILGLGSCPYSSVTPFDHSHQGDLGL